MKTAFVSLATAALLVARAVGQSLQINTPANVVVCQPISLTWSGGTPPYFLSILPGSQPGAAALEDLGQQSGTSFTWIANIPAGTSIGLTLRDSTGTTAQSAAFTINPGSDISCVGKTSTGSSGSTSAGSTSGGATTTAASSAAASTPAVTTSPLTTATSAKATTTAPTTAGSTTGSAAGTATTSHNGGPTQAASLGVAGFFGAAVIALLA